MYLGRKASAGVVADLRPRVCMRHVKDIFEVFKACGVAGEVDCRGQLLDWLAVAFAS